MLFTFPSQYLFTIGRRVVLRLRGWSPYLQTGFRVSRPTQGLFAFYPYGAITLYGQIFQNILVIMQTDTGLIRVRSSLLTESRLISFPLGTKIFQFPRFASCFQDTEINPGEFPHSEIYGSKVVGTSPQLIAAYYVLHRLPSPRHPPNALSIFVI